MNGISCDDAFLLLTSSARSTSAELSLHLQQCRRCRQLAETLSPLFAHLPTPTVEDRPGNTGPGERAQTVARETAERLTRAADVRQSQASSSFRELQHASRGGRYLVTFLFGAICTLLVVLVEIPWPHLLTRPDTASRSGIASAGMLPGAQSASSVCLWKNRGDSPPKTAPEMVVFEKATAADVVLSCVACHLAATSPGH